jgi:hypothetical protein
MSQVEFDVFDTMLLLNSTITNAIINKKFLIVTDILEDLDDFYVMMFLAGLIKRNIIRGKDVYILACTENSIYRAQAAQWIFGQYEICDVNFGYSNDRMFNDPELITPPESPAKMPLIPAGRKLLNKLFADAAKEDATVLVTIISPFLDLAEYFRTNKGVYKYISGMIVQFGITYGGEPRTIKADLDSYNARGTYRRDPAFLTLEEMRPENRIKEAAIHCDRFLASLVENKVPIFAVNKQAAYGFSTAITPRIMRENVFNHKNQVNGYLLTFAMRRYQNMWFKMFGGTDSPVFEELLTKENLELYQKVREIFSVMRCANGPLSMFERDESAPATINPLFAITVWFRWSDKRIAEFFNMMLEDPPHDCADSPLKYEKMLKKRIDTINVFEEVQSFMVYDVLAFVAGLLFFSNSWTLSEMCKIDEIDAIDCCYGLMTKESVVTKHELAAYIFSIIL